MNAPFRPANLETDRLRLLKIGEVARLTSMHRSTIYRLVGAGDFPAQIQLSKQRVAWRAADIEAWIERRQT